MSKKLVLRPITIAIFAAMSSFSFATTDADLTHHHQPSQQLAPIVVTVQPIETTQGVVSTLDPKQPIQPIPAADGGDYLQNIMGFNAVKNGGANGDVTFRGMFGSRLKIMTNGAENLGACPSRMDSPSAYISPESFDKITITKGPQTVLYPHTASAVTVNFERQAPKLTQEQPYQGQASVMAGSFGRLDHHIESTVGLDQAYIRLNANRSVSDNYQDGQGHSVHSAWERWNADVALGWTPNENSWLELSAGKGDGHALYAGRTMDGSKFERESIALRAEKRHLTDVISKIEAQVSYQFNDHVMDNFSLREFKATSMMPMPRASNPSRRTLNSRFAVTHDWDKMQFITGFDYQNNKHQRRMGIGNSYKDLARETDMTFDSYGWFGEINRKFNDQHQLFTGIRVDHADINQKVIQTQRSETLPSGFLRLESSYQEGQAKSYAGIGYVERIPDYWELRIAQSNANTQTLMQHLKNEKTVQLDLGYQQQIGDFKSWISAYAGFIQDYILVRYTGTNVNRIDNVDATIAGAEAGLSYAFTDRWQGDISAMYAWGKNTTDHKPLPQIAPLEVHSQLRYVHDRFSAGLLWRTVAKQNRISLNEGTIVGYDLQPSKAFNTLALNGSYRLKEGINVSVGIDNVFNKTYTEHLNRAGASGFGFASNQQFNEIGRNYWARMDIKF